MQGKGAPLPLQPIPKTNNNTKNKTKTKNNTKTKTKTKTNYKIKVVYTEDLTHPIRGNRFPHSFQLEADSSVVVRSPFVDIQYSHRGNPLAKPVLIILSMPGLRDTQPILRHNNYRNGQTLGAGGYFQRPRFAVRGSRQGVRIQDQRHISTSIFSKSSSIR